MNARRAKTRALLRMERKPTPHGAWFRFIPVRRLALSMLRAATMSSGAIGQVEEVRFVVSPTLDVLRQ